MGTTTRRRRPEHIGAVSPSRNFSSDATGDRLGDAAEVLIKEARRRQRWRWGFCALALIAAVGLLAGLLDTSSSSPPTRDHHGPATASPGEVAAFVSQVEKGFSGQFLARYAVQYGTGRRAVRGSVVAAQVSKTKWAYISSPSFQDIHAAKSTSAVLESPVGERAGRYSCGRQSASSPWTCVSFSTAGMGTNAALLGPYPPSALTLGLQNAVVEYSGKTSGEHVAPQPAHLVVRDVDAHKLSCLVSGRPARPAALVCLDAANVITSYDIPPAVSNIAYSKAELRSYSTHVRHSVLALPARPATTAPVPGTPPCGGNQVGTGVRPEVIAIDCATGAEYLKNITWEKWNGSGLDGLAELYTRSANGAVSAARVKIGLSNSGYVSGKLVFRTLSFTTATGPQETLTVPRESWGWVTSGR